MYSNKEQKQFFDLSKQFLEIAITKEHLEGLRKVLVYHEWKYAVQNNPVVSDFEYDQLYKKLEALELAHPELVSSSSPTQRVASDLTEDFQTVEHLVPMLSLANSYNAEDLKDFDTQIKKFAMLGEEDAIEYVVEPKYDGGSIALVYEDNRLTRGATRGNGTRGDEITANARVMKSVPLTADFKSKGIHKVELRGEVVIRKDVFDKMNKQRAKDGKILFANPRNTATGGLRMKDPKEASQRGLVAFLYQLGYATDEAGNDVIATLETHDESVELLNQLGFKVPTVERKLCKNIEEAAAFCAEWEAKRESYNYEIDGMVVKVNSRELQERSGYTSHHPRWAIAYKFKAKQATTKLINIEYQVGKIGSIAPVAKLEPVQLAGVTVSSVSLHNADFISGKDLRLNDTVLVERAGDVIPYIVKSMEELRDGSEVPVVFPTVCPINDTETPVPLIRAEGESAWRCPDCVCGQQPLQRMIFHVSKPAMNIDGMGEKQVEQFYQKGWVKDLPDIYALPYDEIRLLEGWGERSATKLEAAITKAKQSPIRRVLHSLSIHHMGKKVSQLVAAQINHVLDLQNWTEEDFVNIKDIGPKVAENIIVYFSNPKNIEMLQRMEANGVNLYQMEDDKPKAAVTEGPFVGKTILFTGSLQKMSRKEAQTKAEAAGARNISGVSSKLDILVVGEKAGSKLKKATALGTVQVMTEDEFVALI